MASPADVLKMIKDNDVKFVDLRFTDTRGKEQHVSVPAKVFDMAKFEDAARSEQRTGFVSEFLYFLRTSKKWWLIPIVVVLLLFGVLVFLSSTAAAPFIYTLF